MLFAVLTLASALPQLSSAQVPPPDDADQRLQRMYEAPNPLARHNSVWIEELTWMEVRDLIREGTTTAIVASGGIEQNGPYLATGKHNYVLDGACEGIARALGNALCAPILKLVPEGNITDPSGSMLYSGTLSLRPATFRAVLEDVAGSLRAHGFTDIIFIGDSGGNQEGMSQVARLLSTRWNDATVHYIPEFYEIRLVFDYMRDELGIEEPTNDGHHDDFVITSIMLASDPSTVRYDERVAADLLSINGLSIEDLDATAAIGRELLQFRVSHAVEAIEERLSAARLAEASAAEAEEPGDVIDQLVAEEAPLAGIGDIAALPSVSFAEDVMPIFERSCVKCHGGLADDGTGVRLEEGLSLMSWETIMAGSTWGSVVEPGDPLASYMLELLVDGDMPDEGPPLLPGELRVIAAWIRDGAIKN